LPSFGNETVDRKSTGARPLAAQEKKTADAPNADSVILSFLHRPPKHEFPKNDTISASPRARAGDGAWSGYEPVCKGSGRTGRIIEADVLKAAASQGRATMASSSPNLLPPGRPDFEHAAQHRRTHRVELSSIPTFTCASKWTAMELNAVRSAMLRRMLEIWPSRVGAGWGR